MENFSTRPFNKGKTGRGLMLLALLLSFFNVFAQELTVRGKVTEDPSGEPLPGVSVMVKGATKGATTDINGNFAIAASKGSVLVFKFIGFADKEVTVGAASTINVSLSSSTKSLQEVVVIGYGTQKRADVTGAVASFNPENLEERPVTRVDQALVGQIAGVQVKQTTGTPGKAFSIQVRGGGSISASKEPLYVIDGFPLSNAGPNGAGNFATGNPLDNINPNDIESIQVLKDAASAAIYGSRAANGVVLITTKRGKSGKPTMSFNSFVGYTEANRKLDMLSPTEWIDRATEMINANYVATYGSYGAQASDSYQTRRTVLNSPPAGSALKINVADGTFNTSYMVDERWFQEGYGGLRLVDWQDQAFRKGLTNNYLLSASGGTENVSYYVSGNYSRQEGMVKFMDYTFYSGRANVEVKANDKLKFGLNISPTYSITNDPGVEGKDNILHQLVSMTPVQMDDPWNVNTFGFGQYSWSTSPNSPLAKLRYTTGETKRFRTLSTVFGEYEIFKGLSFRSTVNFDNTDNTSKSFVPYTITGSLASRISQPNQGTSGSETGYRRQTFVAENTLSYRKTFNANHDISLLAGTSYNQNSINNIRIASNGGYSNSSITTLNAAAGVTGFTGETRNVLISYFGRTQYSYKSKYMLSASLRRDGASQFGYNTKWGIFPSVSAGWRIAEEPFMKSVSQISDLKLRASWGKTGNNSIGDYDAISILGFNNYTFNSTNAPGQAPSRITNPELSWEKSETFDVGVDFGLFSNRLTGSFDYYRKLNRDFLFRVPILRTTGFNTLLDNAGKVSHKGWELELTSRNVAAKNFKWNTTINFSHNENKLLELPNGQSQLLIPSAFDISHSILKVGEPIYSIYVVKQIGILTQEDIGNNVARFGSQTVGDPKYFDADGNGTIDANDRMIVGNPNPDYTWGITNTFRYKKFDLNFLVQGQWGGEIYSLLGRALGRTGQGASDNALGFYRDRWRSPENPGDGTVGKAYSTFGRIKNTDWLYSSDYLRVRNITLGYDLGSAMKLKQIKGARLYVTAENFFGYDKYKGGFNPEAANTDVSGSDEFPEAGDYGGLPLPKSLVFGLTINF
ncbi:SusC/RagA family TonB-linked outer membrane protein [Desertivirga brevis]|uniref:SusC/RagA family TonB-linked outer membrane protein n=1 Tax=Desertivirga brevis TaxID=2810310 RepID=UPI001A972DF0|nr:TonB-dependent receptor [Pedobacter sp. SYSU D00873]